MRKTRTGGFKYSPLIPMLLLAISAMTGCASGTVGIKAPAPSTPQDLLVPCPQLPMAQSGQLEDLSLNHKAVTSLYYDCQAKDLALIAVVKDDEPSWWEFWKIWW